MSSPKIPEIIHASGKFALFISKGSVFPLITKPDQ